MKIKQLQNLMVSIAMKKNLAGEVLAAEFPRVHRTLREQEALNRLYRETASVNTPSLDVDRLKRCDASGQQQVDGGYILFGSEGQQLVCLQRLPADLAKFGFVLSIAEVFTKEGDESRIRLRLTWTRGGAEQTLTKAQQKICRRYADQIYWKVYGFFNQAAVGLTGEKNPIQGSIITLNLTGLVNHGQSETNSGSVRDIRMVDADGHLRCESRGQQPARVMAPACQTLEEALDSAYARRDTREPRQVCPSKPTIRAED